MQKYSQTAVSYAGHYVTRLKQWWYPSQQLPQNPLDQLKIFLQNSHLSFKTKHTQQKIVIDRLCVMYHQLIQSQNGKYGCFLPHIETPLQYISPINNNQQNQKNKSVVVSLAGQIKINTDKIKCNLLVTLILHQSIQSQLPTIYIRNPNPTKTQSNPKFTTASQIYTSILGGVTLTQSSLKKQKQDWKQYKSQNLLNLIKKIDITLNQYFPYIKRTTIFQQPDIQSQQFKKIIKYKDLLSQHLNHIQSLSIIKSSLQSENQYLLSQNQKLKIILNQQHLKSSLSNHLLSLFTISENQQLLQFICIEKSLLDCIKLVQQIPSAYQDLNYQNSIQIIKNLSIKLFQVRYKIKQIVEKLSGVSKTIF